MFPQPGQNAVGICNQIMRNGYKREIKASPLGTCFCPHLNSQVSIIKIYLVVSIDGRKKCVEMEHLVKVAKLQIDIEFLINKLYEVFSLTLRCWLLVSW